ncbi:hypothetical protein ACJJIQ_00145 (plasmid) [Microbulbifer sp. ANSA003]|uniref:hypothetical protein n=1 Tax=Microbulbifer sp. ANSA003 TaxID=3243360 RepID=UPI004041D80E
MIDISTPASRNYFTDKELQCKCNNCKLERLRGGLCAGDARNMNSEFLAHLNRVRERVYVRSMSVSSGFRCRRHSEEVRKREQAEHDGKPYVLGDHPSGVGVDVRVHGIGAHDLMQALHVYNWLHTQAGLPQPFTAICPHQRGPLYQRFIHIGGNVKAPGRRRPWLWTY